METNERRIEYHKLFLSWLEMIERGGYPDGWHQQLGFARSAMEKRIEKLRWEEDDHA